jgi:flagellar basal-body rod protein FlgB
MFIDDLLTSGSIPALEATLRFAGQRQQLISHNIANLETPYFRPVDVSPRGFQSALDRAVQKRRESNGGMAGPLPFEDTREVRVRADGELELTPRTGSGNILFHDRSNNDLDRLMQANAENSLVYRATTELLRSRYAQLRDAIAERV